MKYPKFKRIFANLTAAAAKVYMSTSDEPLSIAEINKRVQSSEHGGPRVFSAVEGCVYSLTRCGLLIENPRGVFRRVPVDDPSAPGAFDEEVDSADIEALAEPDDAPAEPTVGPTTQEPPVTPLKVHVSQPEPMPLAAPARPAAAAKQPTVLDLIKATSAKVTAVRSGLDEIEALLQDMTRAALVDVDTVATAKAEVKRLDKIRALAAQLKEL